MHASRSFPFLDPNPLITLSFFLFSFLFFKIGEQTYKKDKTQLGLGNPKFKLRTKIHGDNASEDASPIVWGMDTTKSRSPVIVIFEVYWVTMTQTPLQ
jgi:hypothetical protein